MKFTDDDYKELKTRVAKITQNMLDLHIKDVKARGGFKDLETRITWDIYYASGMSDNYIYKKYTYQNNPYTDAHIETATKKAIKEAGLIIK